MELYELNELQLIEIKSNFNENLLFNKLSNDRLYSGKVKMPAGKGNILFIGSENWDNSISFLERKDFMLPPSYKMMFYPKIIRCKFMNKMINLNLNNVLKDRKGQISNLKMTPYNGLKIANGDSKNIVFNLSDMIEKFGPIAKIGSISKVMDEYLKTLFEYSFEFLPKDRNEPDDANWNKIVVLDPRCFHFSMNAKLKDNIHNPLFVLYLTYLRRKNLTFLGLDMTFIVTNGKSLFKFNPAEMTDKKFTTFRMLMNKIMDVNLDKFVDDLNEEDKKEIHNIASPDEEKIIKKIDPTGKVSHRITAGIAKSTVEDIKTNRAKQNQSAFNKTEDDTENPTGNIEKNPTPSDDTSISDEEINKVLSNETTKEFIMKDVMDDIVPMSTVKQKASSARDARFREAHLKVRVADSTIGELLQNSVNHVDIETIDVSEVSKSLNKNMKQIRFANFDKTYLEKSYVRDIVNSFSSLADKETPIFIESIKIKDNSTSRDLQDLYTVKFVDQRNNKFTCNVNIPKFHENKFMLMQGTKYVLKKQNYPLPVIKDSPNTVIITTSYNKIRLERYQTKSMAGVEKIMTLINKMNKSDIDASKYFQVANVSSQNLRYASSLEYDEFSKRIAFFKTDKCEIYFSRQRLKEELLPSIKTKTNDIEFIIGTEDGNPIIIDSNTGYDKYGRTISDIILQNIPEEAMPAGGLKIKPPKTPMYVYVSILNQKISVIAVLLSWIGLYETLSLVSPDWEFIPGNKVPNDPSFRYIKFKDGHLKYKHTISGEIIMNSFSVLNPQKYEFKEFEDDGGPLDTYLYSIFGDRSAKKQLKQFREFLIDPITKEVCAHYSLPDTAHGLLFHASELLADNDHKTKASDDLYRTRSIEIIPSILYSELAKQYANYISSGGRQPMTLNPDIIMKNLKNDKSHETYATLNPAREIAASAAISNRGFRGTNMSHAYKEDKRSYDESSIAKLAIYTSPDANVGIARELTLEPTISGIRGYRTPTPEGFDVESFKDVQLFSGVELMTPGTIRNDDAIRCSIASRQTSHITPTTNAIPSLVSNGFDEAIQHHLSSDYVVNAKEDGEVVEYNEKTGFVVVKYDSGEYRAIDTRPTIFNNTSSGFFTLNELTPIYTKPGERFKQHEPLAYHSKFFKYSKFNGLRSTIGPLAKVAFMSSYNTYEDAGICTDKLADKLETKIIQEVYAKLKKNADVVHMLKIGDSVTAGQTLLKFSQDQEDKALSNYLSTLSDSTKDLLLDNLKSDITSDVAGVIKDIKVETISEISEMCPSLGAIVQNIRQQSIDRKEFLEKYDNSEGIIKAGHLFTESTSLYNSKYGDIEKEQGIDVLIKFYIEYPYVMGTGDKVAILSANKQVISEMIEPGLEPWSFFRPEESIDVLTSMGTIARRFTPSVLRISTATKVLIELKRKINEDFNSKKVTRANMEKTINTVFDLLDPTKSNSKKYIDLFKSMNDKEWYSYIKEFLELEEENFILETVEFEVDLKIENVQKAADYLKVPLMEYVALPHLNPGSDDVVVTPQPVMVGYLPIKRVQQLLHKKNGLAIKNEHRNLKTNQVEGGDKRSRNSDIEAMLLTAIGADYTLQEFHGPRSDDRVMKQEMNEKIYESGVFSLSELTNSVTNKVTLNTVNTYLLSMGIKSDLITDSYFYKKIY